MTERNIAQETIYGLQEILAYESGEDTGAYVIIPKKNPQPDNQG